MSMREDLEAMRIAKKHGLLKEFMNGTAPAQLPDILPSDSSTANPANTTYGWLCQRDGLYNDR